MLALSYLNGVSYALEKSRDRMRVRSPVLELREFPTFFFFTVFLPFSFLYFPTCPRSRVLSVYPWRNSQSPRDAISRDSFGVPIALIHAAHRYSVSGELTREKERRGWAKNVALISIPSSFSFFGGEKSGLLENCQSRLYLFVQPSRFHVASFPASGLTVNLCGPCALEKSRSKPRENSGDMLAMKDREGGRLSPPHTSACECAS